VNLFESASRASSKRFFNAHKTPVAFSDALWPVHKSTGKGRVFLEEIGISFREIPISSEDLPISLEEIHKSGEEIGISLSHLYIAPEGLEATPEESGVKPQPTK